MDARGPHSQPISVFLCFLFSVPSLRWPFSCSSFHCVCGRSLTADERVQAKQALMQAMRGGAKHSSSSSSDQSEAQAKQQLQEEEHKQSGSSSTEAARFQPCMRCKEEATSFCASCGGDLCAEHDTAAHSAVDAAAHACVMQADKAALLQAMAEGSESAFHKSAQSCKASVQGVLRTLAELETRLKLETKGNEG